jgi:hypothetical protein
MGGLLFSAVRSGAVDLPRELVSVLQRADLRQQLHNERLWRSLETVQGVADELGVRIANLKGVTAEARWYTRVGERVFADVDVLVCPADLSRTRELVTALQPDHPLRDHVESLVAERATQALELDVDGISVDLHLDLLKLGIESHLAEELWDRTIPLALPGRPAVRVLEPEAALLNLLVHLNKDRFWRLAGLADVARLLERDQPAWADVEQLARRDGLGTAARESLRAVQDELGVTPSVSHAGGWRAGLWRIVWSPRVRLQGELGLEKFRYRQMWIPLTMQGRLGDTLVWWLRRLLPPAVLVADKNQNWRGGYLRRLTAGRVERFRVRRRTVAGLHKQP